MYLYEIIDSINMSLGSINCLFNQLNFTLNRIFSCFKILNFYFYCIYYKSFSEHYFLYHCDNINYLNGQTVYLYVQNNVFNK